MRFVVAPTRLRVYMQTGVELRARRSLKGFRIRQDYQRRYDVLVATLKHTQGKKGPELIEEALELLFDKYADALT